MVTKGTVSCSLKEWLFRAPHLTGPSPDPNDSLHAMFPCLNGRARQIGVATPAEPCGEKKFYFLQILGGEKLLKFVERCR